MAQHHFKHRSRQSARPFIHHPILWSFIGGLLLLRLLLPFVVLREANARLATLPDYKGHIRDVHLALWRGTIELNDLTLRHDSDDIQLTIDHVVMNLRWGPLIQKKIVIKLWIEKPALLILTQHPEETAKKAVPKTATKPAIPSRNGYQALPDALLKLIPFQVEWLQLDGGKIIVRPLTSTVPTPKHQLLPPHSELLITDIDMKLSNLTNSRRLAGTLTAEGLVSAKIMSEGRMQIGLRVNPLAKTPTFDLTFELKKFELADLSPLVNWQADLLVKKGLFELYAGAQAADGGFQGYVKPFLQDLKVDTAKNKKGPIQTLKKIAINVVSKILKNDDTKKVATKIPFQGRFDNPNVGLYEAVINVLRNAFVAAIQPRLE